jgi:hypothetical protein
MTTNGKLESSALRDELVRIDTVIEATKQDEADTTGTLRLNSD